MKLYRIRRKDTKQFFASYLYYKRWRDNVEDCSYWTDSGVFWKKIDTARKTLGQLCSVMVQKRTAKHGFLYWDFESFNRRKLKNYEVVVTDVLNRGDEVIPAQKFFEKKKK